MEEQDVPTTPEMIQNCFPRKLEAPRGQAHSCCGADLFDLGGARLEGCRNWLTTGLFPGHYTCEACVPLSSFPWP